MNSKIIHLKNIIIFKILIYILCITFFCFIFPISQDTLQDSINKTNIARSELQDLENKVAFITNAQDIINSSYQDYTSESKSPFDVSCFIHSDLNKKYIELGNSFNLTQTPKLFSSTTQSINDSYNSQSITILTTKIMLSFKAENISKSIDFIVEAYKQLPKYSLITSFDIENPDFITPQSIHALKANVIPSIITTNINMLIREIQTKN